MEKNKFLKIVVVCLLLLNLGILAFLFISNGHDKKRHRSDGERGPAKFMIEQLGFNDQQTTQFNELKSEHQQQMRQLQDSMRIQRDQFADVIIEGNNAKADSITTIIGKYQQQMDYYTYLHFVKVRSICNDEQKKKFKTIIHDILHMMGPRKGDHPPR